jgi:hypothetical protein
MELICQMEERLWQSAPLLMIQNIHVVTGRRLPKTIRTAGIENKR